MNTVYLMVNRGNANVPALTRELAAALRQAGLKVQAESWLRERFDGLFDPADSPAEAVVAAGGDGTLLRANQEAVKLGVPLLGVNAGHIGFLTESEPAHLAEAARRLREDRYEVEKRMMLQVVRADGKRSIALNDVVFSRGGYARLIALRAWVGEDLIGRYVADGLIVSTPTGSTGYSLSAGGPIICPKLDCLLLTPACAHSLQHRPAISSASDIVAIELEVGRRAQIDIDGQPAGTLKGGERVTVSKAAEEARFIRFDGRSFFQLIRYKLSEWSC